MLNRLSLSALLKAVILTTAFCVVIAISLNAWDSWGRLQMASRAADNVKQASETLETQSQQLGNQVTDFLGKIRAA